MSLLTPRPPFDLAVWRHHIDAAQVWLDQHDLLNQLSESARNAGYDLGIFGGATRDLLLFGQLSNDVDCVVASSKDSYDEAAFVAWGQSISAELGLEWMEDPRPHHWAARNEETRFSLDVAWCHDLTVFLKQTDYSMNGIAYQMQAKCWLDPNNGLTDLAQRRLVIPNDRRHFYFDSVNRWTRLFLLMVHTNSQPTPDILAWLMAHRAELEAMTTQNPIGNLIKLFRAISYPGWGAHYITQVWAESDFLTTVFTELAPWLQSPHGTASVLHRWTQTTQDWDTYSPEQQAWLKQPYPDYDGITLFGMLRMAMILLPVLTQPLPEGMSIDTGIEALHAMIERLGLQTEPFPTVLSHAVTLCALGHAEHPIAAQWLSEHPASFIQDYHQSLYELLASP